MGYYSTAGVEFIRNEMDWDTHDAWGSVMAALFDICEAWWEATGESVAGFRPSQVDPHEFDSMRAAQLYHAMIGGIIDKGDVTYWIKVLDRMRDLVIKAGREY